MADGEGVRLDAAPVVAASVRSLPGVGRSGGTLPSGVHPILGFSITRPPFIPLVAILGGIF